MDSELSNPLAPQFRLYSIRAVDIATALGSVIAGTYLLCANCRAAGNPEGARRAIYFGIAAAVLVIGASLLEPTSWELPAALYQAVQVAAIHGYASRTHSHLVETHKSAGGKLFSNWRGAGVGTLIALVIVALIAFAFLFVLPADLASQRIKAFESAPTDRFSWTEQLPSHEMFESLDHGPANHAEFVARVRNYKWREAVELSHKLRGPAPTLTLRHGGLDRYLAISGVGDPAPSDDVAFYLFWGRGSTGEDPRFLPVEELDPIETLVAMFFSEEVSRIDTIFATDGLPMEASFGVE
jgi:hypothetical protein